MGKKSKHMNSKKSKGAKTIDIKKAVVTIGIILIIVITVINIQKTDKEVAYEGERLEFQEEMDLESVTLEESQDAEPQKVPVPKGYVGSPIDSEREVNGGFVIYELKEGETAEVAKASIESDHSTAKKERNQWVWVPIADEGDMYHMSSGKMYGNSYTFKDTGYTKSTISTNEPKILSSYDKETTYLTQYMNGISKEEFLAEMQQEFYEMVKSVATYGGFYIGRYETGDLSQNVPVVRRMNEDIHSQTWYSMYKKSKRISGKNTNVVTHMIWGIQWDETLKWLIDTNKIDSSKGKTAEQVGKDSSSWGNYNGVSFQYENKSGGTSTKSTSSTRIPTGSALEDRNMANNIYDLAGNVFDWTMEGNGSSNRYCRGGNYYDTGTSYPASGRYGGNPDSSYLSRRLACRTLYIVALNPAADST